MNGRFADALSRGDAKAASALYTGHARLLAPSSDVVEGREAIERFWRAGIEAGISEVEREAVDVQRNDGLAYEIGRYVLRLDPLDGDAVVDRGNYLLVHERQPDGTWLCSAEMFAPDTAPELDKEERR
jgi:ketosteroid isomerase-like protein